ncbi:Gfo/Idh/MocA family protein [Jeotgalibacillus marinus]|uniref:Gfo/Idh/MocA family oxidoreductase n=1 Tax=Jeotgalibacillus marinus TaxID=86667 RepID=A0ABV3Q758_9BACL
MRKVNVGIIGCGNISAIYLENCRKFEQVCVVACADLDFERAVARAKEFNIPHALTVEELIAHPNIEIVISLTPPNAHEEIGLQVLEAGKHLYTEKPLATSFEGGKRVLEKAREKGLLVNAAPDTILGAGLQTSRHAIQQGLIGTPTAATAFLMKSGIENWHPNPEFFYQKGGGPMYDMGPYYLSALIQLLGPIHRVAASAQMTNIDRFIQIGKRRGEKINVQTPTHLSGTLDFKNGAVATMITSFDVSATRLPHIEIYGTEGTLSVPDPNTFGGPVLVKKNGEDEWTELPLISDKTTNLRGLGVVDMASYLSMGTPQQMSGQLPLHVLEAMHAFHESSLTESYYKMTTETIPPTLMQDTGERV